MYLMENWFVAEIIRRQNRSSEEKRAVQEDNAASHKQIREHESSAKRTRNLYPGNRIWKKYERMKAQLNKDELYMYDTSISDKTQN